MRGLRHSDHLQNLHSLSEKTWLSSRLNDCLGRYFCKLKTLIIYFNSGISVILFHIWSNVKFSFVNGHTNTMLSRIKGQGILETQQFIPSGVWPRLKAKVFVAVLNGCALRWSEGNCPHREARDANVSHKCGWQRSLWVFHLYGALSCLHKKGQESCAENQKESLTEELKPHITFLLHTRPVAAWSGNVFRTVCFGKLEKLMQPSPISLLITTWGDGISRKLSPLAGYTIQSDSVTFLLRYNTTGANLNYCKLAVAVTSYGRASTRSCIHTHTADLHPNISLIDRKLQLL